MIVPREVSQKTLPEGEGRPEITHTFEGTSDEDRSCCTFAVTLINKKPPPWPWSPGWSFWSWLRWVLHWLLWWWVHRATQVRITALAGTTILNAYSDTWNQLSSLPNSVIWEPGQGLPLPWGDPPDGEIDQDFLLSLGPMTGVKNLKIETLSANAAVLDVFEIAIPCFPADDVDFETNWEHYTSVVQGGQNIFVFMEPDDCDPGEFDYKASCTIKEISRTCDSSSGNRYVLTLKGPESSQCTSYTWAIQGPQSFGPFENTIDAVNATANTTPHIYQSPPLPPAAANYSVTITIMEPGPTPNSAPVVISCSENFRVLGVDPEFTWHQEPCTQTIILNSLATGNKEQVNAWDWTCQQFPIPSGEEVEFSPGAEGSYSVTLHAMDKYGCEWTVTRTVEVVTCNASFEGVYSWCVDKIDPNLIADITVSFTNTSFVCSPSFAWDFADPNGSPVGSSTDQDPTFTFEGVKHGDVCFATLNVNDLSNNCHDSVKIEITFMQREHPDFWVEICPNGKGTFHTSAQNPGWTVTPTSPAPAPNKLGWPFSKKDRSTVVYCFQDGAYTMKLESKNANWNKCSAEKSFVVEQECCTKLGVLRMKSSPITVQLSSGPVELRVKGRLWQLPFGWGARIGAKTMLFKKNSNNKWRRFKSNEVELEASFTGTVYGPELPVPGMIHGTHYAACRCTIAEATNAVKKKANRRRVWAGETIVGLPGDPWLAKPGSVVSNHALSVAGQTFPLMSLSLGSDPFLMSVAWGPAAQCDECSWWSEQYWI